MNKKREKNEKRNGQDELLILFESEDREKIDLFSLVLTARNIPHKVKKLTSSTYAILVKKGVFDKAKQEIELFTLENKHFFARRKAQKRHTHFIHLKESLLSILILTSLMSLTFRYEIRDFLLKNFSADAEKILEGEIWRVVSALFLHSDPAHFFSNVFMSAIFFTILFEETGLFKGWLIVIFSGGLGNYLNAIFYGKNHISIGLSTAIFGAIGAFCTIRIFKERFKGAKEGFKVFLSGLALLGILGASPDRNIDISAHFFGFFAGMFIGALFFIAENKKKV